MAWSFTDLRYGWKIAAGIVLAGATIFVANNQRQRINQADAIEIVLGVTERCLATQYGTYSNAVVTTNSGIVLTNWITVPNYYVAPPSFVRSWYSNSYELQVTTNGLGTNAIISTNWVNILHTNLTTNTIGWRTDRAMMVDLDNTIKDLVQYYVDTNTVFDGSSNISMLTVTGLWASLAIGDYTNQFTSIPAWVGTNGVTNAATFGPWAWRNYIMAWKERYKVLNALNTLPIDGAVIVKTRYISPYGIYGTPYFTIGGLYYGNPSGIEGYLYEPNVWTNPYAVNNNTHVAMVVLERDYFSVNAIITNTYLNMPLGIYPVRESAGFTWGENQIGDYSGMAISAVFTPTNFSVFDGQLVPAFYFSHPESYVSRDFSPTDRTLDTEGDFDPITTNCWKLFAPQSITASGSVTVAAGSLTMPLWAQGLIDCPDSVTGEWPDLIYGWDALPPRIRGYRVSDRKMLFKPDFNYCTNKFW